MNDGCSFALSITSPFLRLCPCRRRHGSDCNDELVRHQNHQLQRCELCQVVFEIIIQYTLSTQLFPQILARCKSSHFFEESSEMMGKIEAEEARGLADVVTVHEQALGLVDDIVVDIADGRSSCRLVDDVAEITRRISQL